MSDSEKWAKYEAEKQKLIGMDLTAAEYEAALKALVDKLKI